MQTTAEAAAPHKESVLTPLKRFQKRYCVACSEGCESSEPRFLACVQAAYLDLILYRNQREKEVCW